MTYSAATFLPTLTKILPAILLLRHADGHFVRVLNHFMLVVQRTLSKQEGAEGVQQGWMGLYCDLRLLDIVGQLLATFVC
jgi:hypothetical protein